MNIYMLNVLITQVCIIFACIYMSNFHHHQICLIHVSFQLYFYTIPHSGGGYSAPFNLHLCSFTFFSTTWICKHGMHSNFSYIQVPASGSVDEHKLNISSKMTFIRVCKIAWAHSSFTFLSKLVG